MATPEQPERIQIQINTPKSSAARAGYRRQKPPWWQTPWAMFGGFLMVAVLAWAAFQAMQPANVPTLKIAESDPLQISESVQWTFQPKIKREGVAKDSLRYKLANAPDGMVVNAKSGKLSWMPTEQQGPAEYEIRLEVASGKLSDATTLKLSVNEVDQPPVFNLLPKRNVQAGEQLQVTAIANDPDLPARRVSYTLDQSPHSAAKLDQTSGRFEWNVPQDLSPGEYRFAIRATETDGSLSSSEILSVIVVEPPPSDDPVVAALKKAGVSATVLGDHTRFPQFSGQGRTLMVNGGEVGVFQYPTVSASQKEADQIREDGRKFFGKEMAKNDRLHVFHDRDLLAVYEGDNSETLAALQSHFGEALVLGPFASSTTEPGDTLPKTDADLDVIAALQKRDRLTAGETYPVLRNLFANRFARKYEMEMQQAWGEDYREMTDWLAKHPEIREDLLTALNPQYDNLPAALGLFNTLRKEFPNQIEAYSQLAIAVSVVWDKPQGSVIDYAHHARRTHSKMPEELLQAREVFRYFVEAEQVMQGRAKFLPWEFLAWMVNDRTPLAERQWALNNYLSRRVQIGKCYKEVPYDHEMLRTSSQVCKLDGKDYVLPNIKQQGGVCAMQADFASRVAKSLGVPAAYVSGASRGGELHAWVMWVELLDVKPNQIQFSLESYGRYRGDKYYVGNLRDPQTGQQTTDREMERKLRVLGINPKAKRHADFAARALEMIDKQEPMKVKEELASHLKILKLCPGHEAAWRKVAELSGSDEIQRDERRMMVQALDLLFKTFSGFPDFTWKVFADITRYEKDPTAKFQLYEKLLGLYQAAGRPDLACEAALAAADLLVQEKHANNAVQKLSVVILLFADEGRYVPRMLDRMEEIYKTLGGTSASLVAFYQKLLPKIPPKRGDSPSPYAIKMYERAIDCFRTNNRPDLANVMTAKLSSLKAK